jgi:hypothetical protein
MNLLDLLAGATDDPYMPGEFMARMAMNATPRPKPLSPFEQEMAQLDQQANDVAAISSMYAGGNLPTNESMQNLTPAQAGMVNITGGGGGGAPHGYLDGRGAIAGSFARREGPAEHMQYSRNAPWQPPLYHTGTLQEEPVDDTSRVVESHQEGDYPIKGVGFVPPKFFHEANGNPDLYRRQQSDREMEMFRQMREAKEARMAPQMPQGPMADLQQGDGGAMAAGPNLVQALAGTQPENPYLPGMPSLAERNANVVRNAMARKESRLARMGEASPMMMGMMDQAMQGGGQGGMNPMLAGMMGGPGAFNVALQNEGLNDRAQMMLQPQMIEALARQTAANADMQKTNFMMSPEGMKAMMTARGMQMPTEPGSLEWLVSELNAKPQLKANYRDFEDYARVAVGPTLNPEVARRAYAMATGQIPGAQPAPRGISGGGLLGDALNVFDVTGAYH